MRAEGLAHHDKKFWVSSECDELPSEILNGREDIERSLWVAGGLLTLSGLGSRWNVVSRGVAYTAGVL